MSVSGEQAWFGGIRLRAAASASVAMSARFSDRRRPSAQRIGFWLSIMAISAAFGAFYSLLERGGRMEVGAIYGGVIGTTVMMFQQGLIAPSLKARLLRWPLVVGVIGMEVVYVLLVLIGSAVAGTVVHLSGLTRDSWRVAVFPTPPELLYSLLVSGAVITVNRMRELIGTEVFRNLLLGRYYTPVEEERIFLFLDLVGSTDYAQTNGDLRAQAFLGAIFAALAGPVRRHRGSIDDYVGDMALITWPLAVGTSDSRCIACVFDFIDVIESQAERWCSEFGQVPRFRAALHGGSVVTAEVGLDRHKIAYFGDVVNTTGRMERLTKTLDAAFLISSELLDRGVALPEGVEARPLGAHAVKGRGESLSVLALEITSGDAPGRRAPATARSANP